ncbi:hypothetical protein [Streptomyces sp. SID3343]|uniref:hypothetical protein n=1 Tax=Streptomyces sp. SID3343 TaxID=2690260 RepID=UPI001371702B|nr:hypothetical protein [Streptomyces sp. SID3343]MYW03344.1 hypothetical protein [Streptomyces sp. SID3343]MYW06250.1 hypothetical protein [Streptomyces sp. SID3343]
MSDSPTTPAEIDAWLLALIAFDVIHDAAQGPNGTWIVRRTSDARPEVLHTPDKAADFVARMQLATRRTALRDAA